MAAPQNPAGAGSPGVFTLTVPRMRSSAAHRLVRMTRLALCFLLAAWLCPLSRSEAQYFGRNKVQYEDFDFQVLKTEHFDIYYYPEEQAAARGAARMAERWYARLSPVLDHELSGRQPLILYASQPALPADQHHRRRARRGHGRRHRGAPAAHRAADRGPAGGDRPRARPRAGARLPVRHDGQGADRCSGGVPGALRMPLWFIEGMAEYLSRRARWTRTPPCGCATPRGGRSCPPSASSASREVLPLPLRPGALGLPGRALRRPGRAASRWRGRRAAQRGRGDDACKGVLAIDAEGALQAVARRAHARPPLPAQTRRPQDAGACGSATGTEKRQGGRLNVAPALSPDGERLAFLSERDLFSIELFVADARTGEVTRRLSSTVTDPHLESLQFINSAGAWDRAGKRFALGAVDQGPAAARDPRRRERQIACARSAARRWARSTPRASRRTASAWCSPALAGGFTDLFVYDLADEHAAPPDRGRLRRPAAGLVARRADDRVRDRPLLHRSRDAGHGDYGLAAAGRRRRAVCGRCPASPAGKNINPQWAPSGRASTSSPTRAGSPTSTASTWPRAASSSSPTSSPASAASPRSARRSRVGRGGPAWPSASTTRTATRSTASTTPSGCPAGRWSRG